ncbi:MAG TPA: diacylglycerol kinase family protein [Actinomycetota bacterium]|nr:diacylglycerol kinase family protein [Actinomycetota bacterium]
MGYLLVANDDAGAGGDDLLAHVRSRLADALVVTLEPGLDLAEHVGSAKADDRVIVAVGGDGTVNAVAQQVVAAGGTMGLVPAGTLNHFARDLGLAETDDAIEALERAETTLVDVGRVGDRLFVNNLGIGLYPEVVRRRERQEDTIGKWPALVVSAVQVFFDFDPLEGVVEADGDRRVLEAAAVFVGNNMFSTEPGRVGTRERLDEGVFDLRIVRTSESVRARSNQAWHAITRLPRRVVRTTARRVRVELRDGARPIALDGEEIGDREVVDIAMEPGALRVVVPAMSSG